MLLKIAKTSILVALIVNTLSATAFNMQAEKDRKALVDYTVAKFKDGLKNKNTFFPYSTDKELKKMKKNVEHNDFKNGVYSFDLVGKMSRDDQMEMPPFEENQDKGEMLYNRYFKTCFPDPAITGEYPKFNEKTKKVVTLGKKILSCAKKTGLKGWKLQGGDMNNLQLFLAGKSSEAGKKVDIKIESAGARDAYENGKKEFYTQRGYLKLSCASCHVQGAGQRVRLEYLSPILGSVTHFPVYRIGKDKTFTLESRLKGCNRNMGEVPHKKDSTWSSDILYFMGYMSNGMDLSGPDVRR
jgi:sulfur-oxidizing protein SoxA